MKVGFAAETQSLRENAAAKIRSKGLDFIVANDVTAPAAGFAHDTNQVTIIGRGWTGRGAAGDVEVRSGPPHPRSSAHATSVAFVRAP